MKTDWWLLGAVAFLVVAGLVMMLSLGSREIAPYASFLRQFAWAASGMALAFGMANVDYRLFRNHAAVVLAIYAFALVLLAAVLVFGTTIHGAKSWLSFGGILVQPIEFTKIALILLLAKYYASKNIELWRFRHLAVTGGYMAIPVVMTALQPDLGSALTLVAIWFGMTIVSGIRRSQLVGLTAFFLILFFLLWGFVLSDRQKLRILAVVRPEAVSSLTLYNVRQAVIAVGAGGLFGEGLGEGSQAQLKFLPAAKTDFVFAALAQELGFGGAAMLFLAFAILLWRTMAIGMGAENNFARLFAIGWFTLLVTHFFINIGMNLGLLPVIGIPLPFVSYGGSNLLANFLGLGILVSIRKHARI